MIVAHARDVSDPKPEPCGADSNISRTTTDIFGEGRRLLQPATHLVTIDVYDCPSHRYQIKGAHQYCHTGNGMDACHNKWYACHDQTVKPFHVLSRQRADFGPIDGLVKPTHQLA